MFSKHVSKILVHDPAIVTSFSKLHSNEELISFIVLVVDLKVWHLHHPADNLIVYDVLSILLVDFEFRLRPFPDHVQMNCHCLNACSEM